MGVLAGKADLRIHNGILQQTVDGGATWTNTSDGIGPVEVLQRAKSLLGQTIARIYGTDFDTTGWFAAAAVANTGSASLSTTERGGVMNISTGTTASSTVSMRTLGFGGLVFNPTTELWYLRCKAKFTTAIDAAAYLGIELAGNAGSGMSLVIGGVGLRSTTNFGYDFYNNAGGSTVNGSLGVALDTNYHIFEMLGDTVNFYVYIDGILRLTVAIPATTTGACCVRFDAANGATAVNRQFNVDDVYVCTAAN